jgi:hypothetical protein
VSTERRWLEEKLRYIEAQMLASLDANRVAHEHAGTKGDLLEIAFRQFLRDHLPSRLSVGHGEVVDLSGSRSAQTDIVIANDDHPLTYPAERAGVYFLEGVDAAGEVKSVLTSDSLQDAIGKAQEFKALHAVESFLYAAARSRSDRARFYARRPWFLIALESQLTLAHISEVLADRATASGIPRLEDMDAVFVLDRGTAINLGDGRGGLQYTSSDAETARGWVTHSNSVVLFSLIQWLASVMPRVIRQHPILLNYVFAESPGRDRTIRRRPGLTCDSIATEVYHPDEFLNTLSLFSSRERSTDDA